MMRTKGGQKVSFSRCKRNLPVDTDAHARLLARMTRRAPIVGRRPSSR